MYQSWTCQLWRWVLVQREQATPTRDELRIWRDYIETAETLRSRLGSRLQSESAISWSDYQVMLALWEADGKSLRSAELAERIGWERSRLSHHLGRMEKRGLIERTRCPRSANGVDVTLTKQGITAFRASSIPHLEAVRELFIGALSPDELAQVGHVTQSIRRHLDLTPNH